jgi:transposase
LKKDGFAGRIIIMETKLVRQRKVYSREFKQEAVRLVREGGGSLAGVARDLGLDENTLRKWKRADEQHGAQAFPGQGKRHDEELARLQRENSLLRQERDILKKAMGYFASAPR